VRARRILAEAAIGIGSVALVLTLGTLAAVLGVLVAGWTGGGW
jgi:hypothetical protein